MVGAFEHIYLGRLRVAQPLGATAAECSTS
jgi:hypothetical protein